MGDLLGVTSIRIHHEEFSVTFVLGYAVISYAVHYLFVIG